MSTSFLVPVVVGRLLRDGACEARMFGIFTGVGHKKVRAEPPVGLALA